jgi:hypothetical protein
MIENLTNEMLNIVYPSKCVCFNKKKKVNTLGVNEGLWGN